MGGELARGFGAGAAAAPTFLVWALQDPLGTPLQRVQVIKGWSENGHAMQQVFDVACSDGLARPIPRRSAARTTTLRSI